MNVGMIAIFEK